MKMKDSRGFTMIEMVVVLAVIAILAAILTPIVTSYVDRARTNASTSDVKKIAAAIIQFNTDTKFWPIYSSTTGAPTNLTANVYDTECTAGNAAASDSTSSWPDVTCAANGSGNLEAVLNQNRMALPTTGKTAWRGAYTETGPDAWGTKYYVNTRYLVPGCVEADHTQHGNCSFGLTTGTPSAVYVLSAGPNQIIDTNFDQVTTNFTAGADDIVVRIK